MLLRAFGAYKLLVAPLLRLGHYSLKPSGLLNRLVPLVLVSNYYVGICELQYITIVPPQ